GAARFAALRLPELAIDDLREAVGPGDRTEDDVAAVAPVAAVGSPLGDVLLAPEAAHPAASVAPLHEDGDAIDEHINSPNSSRSAATRSGAWTMRTIADVRAPLRVAANRVRSLRVSFYSREIPILEQDQSEQKCDRRVDRPVERDLHR